MQVVNRFHRILRAAVFAIGLIVTVAPSALPAQAAQNCQCTDYVANAYGLAHAYPNAQDWGNGYLQSQGFHRVSDPSPWGIVVFSGQYPNLGSSVGHVALVNTAVRGSSGWTLTVRGANQAANSNNYWTEANCSNVSDWTLAHPVPYSSPYVSYWMR